MFNLFGRSPKEPEQSEIHKETLCIGMDTISKVLDLENRDDLTPEEKAGYEREVAERFKGMGWIVAPCSTRPFLRFRKDAETMRKLQDLIEVDGAGSIFRLINLTHAWMQHTFRLPWKVAQEDKPKALETVEQALQDTELIIEGLEAKSNGYSQAS